MAGFSLACLLSLPYLLGTCGLSGGRRELPDGDRHGLLFVDLGEGGDPGGRLVGAAAGGFVEAEGLERSGKGEE